MMIVVAVIVAIGVIFGISKAVGGFMPGKVVTEEKEKKVSVPDIRGMTEERQEKHSQRRTSDISQQVRSLQTNMKKARLRNRIQNQEKK